MNDLDWCKNMLPKVSRTFAMGIQMMPAPFESWITIGYLLCRVVDTIEDTENLAWPVRKNLFDAFETALQSGDIEAFNAGLDVIPNNDDGELCQGLDRILNCMYTFPEPVQDSLRKWVGEMTGGMAIYAKRHTFTQGLTTLMDMTDLDRYCYFVAGTVGHLLTDLFLLGAPKTQQNANRLREHSEGFGLLLQMTNIVKDVTDDHPREWCFIPASVCSQMGTTSAQLLDPTHSRAAQAAVDQVNLRARTYYADAVAYVLALPETEVELRRFCLFPMLLAGQTLDLALGNPACITPDQAVKISRQNVMEVAALVEDLVDDDLAIAALTLIEPAQA
jgi:phytoene/squalene synthetase